MFSFQIYITNKLNFRLKFIYSEKATKFREIFALLLTTVHTVKCKVKISQIFVAFSEYMNFIAHPRIFQLFMKGEFDTYVLWPLAKMVKSNTATAVYQQ